MNDGATSEFIVKRKTRLSAALPGRRLGELAAAGVVLPTDEVLDAATRAPLGPASKQPWFCTPASGVSASKVGLLAGRELLGLHFPLWRLAFACCIAAVADLVGWMFAFVPPVGIGVDACVALLLWLALGRPLMLIPVFIVESIPGLNFLPLWTLVIIGIGVFGGIPGGASPPSDGPIGSVVAPMRRALERHAKRS
jgi:hypothetical protein